MGEPGWVVLLVDLSVDEDVLDELVAREGVTGRQLVRIRGQLNRLGLYGLGLDGDYFDKVAGSRRRLWEFRLTADGVEFRLLYKLRGTTFVMLKGYKHKRRNDVQRHLGTAEKRLDEWDGQHEAQ